MEWVRPVMFCLIIIFGLLMTLVVLRRVRCITNEYDINDIVSNKLEDDNDKLLGNTLPNIYICNKPSKGAVNCIHKNKCL